MKGKLGVFGQASPVFRPPAQTPPFSFQLHKSYLNQLIWLLVVLAAGACQPAARTSTPTTTATGQAAPVETAPARQPTRLPTGTIPASEPGAGEATQAASPRAQLEAPRRLANGKILAAPSFSDDGSLLLVPTAAGIFLHEADDLALSQAIPGLVVNGFAAISPDNQLLACEQLAGVGLYDLTEGTLLQQLPGPPGSLVSSLAISPDGRLLSAGFDTGAVQVWSLPTGEEVITLPGDQVEFSPDSERLAVTDSATRQALLYSTAGWTQEGEWPGEQAIFSPSGELGVLDRGAFRLYDPQTGQIQQAFNGFSPAFSADGSLLAMFNLSQVHLYDTASGERLRSMEGEYAEITQMAFSPDGQTLAASTIVEECPGCLTTLGPLAIWQVANGSLVQAIGGFNFPPWLAFAPDGSRLLAAEPDRLQALDPLEGSVIAGLPAYAGDVLTLAFSPDGQQLATAGYASDSARLWQVSDGSLARQLEDPAQGNNWFNGNMAFSPGGDTLAVGSDLWGLPAGKQLTPLEQELVETYHLAASSVAFAPTGGSVLFGFLEGRLDLWDLASQSIAASLTGYTGEVTSLSYSPDGSLLASVFGYPDFAIQVWTMPQAAPLQTLRGEHFFRAAFSPDWKRLASLATTERFTEYNLKAGTAAVWDPQTGKQLTKLAIEDASSLAWSPDGALLATGSFDGNLRLWQLADGQLLQTLQAHFSPLRGLAFSPDGNLLASGAEDGSAFLWQVNGR